MFQDVDVVVSSARRLASLHVGFPVQSGAAATLPRVFSLSLLSPPPDHLISNQVCMITCIRYLITCIRYLITDCIQVITDAPPYAG